MAITVNVQPSASGFFSVGNPIEALVSSTNTALANFKFLVTIYGGGVLLATLRYDIIPGTTKAYINASNILRSKIAENITTLRTSTSVVNAETAKWHTGRVDYQEYFGAIPAASGSVTTGNTFYFYNGSLKYNEWQRGDLAFRKIDSSSAVHTLNQRFLSQFTNYAAVLGTVIDAAPGSYLAGQYPIKKINHNQLSQLQWLWEGSGGTQNAIRFFAYKADYSGGLLQNVARVTGSNYTSMNNGTAVLIVAGLALDNTYKFITAAVINATNQLTATYLFEIDWAPCSRFDSFEIHWLNRVGGWDNWIFDKRSNKETVISRKEFNPTKIPISGDTIVHNSYDISNKNFIVSTKEKYTVQSDWLSQANYAAMEDLITSPLIYWNSADGFINIAINNPETFIKKINTVDKLFNIRFDFEIDNQDRRQ